MEYVIKFVLYNDYDLRKRFHKLKVIDGWSILSRLDPEFLKEVKDLKNSQAYRRTVFLESDALNSLYRGITGINQLNAK